MGPRSEQPPGQHAAYPWNSLERVPRSTARAARTVRPLLEGAAPPAALAGALGELVAADVSIVVRRATAAAGSPRPDRALHFQTADGRLGLVLEPEPDLATALVARLLGRAPRATLPTAPLDDSLRGALAALGIEAARRSGAAIDLRALPEGGEVSPGLSVEATLFLDERPYGLTAWAFERRLPSSGVPRTPDLTRLGAWPVSVPVVAACSITTRSELAALEPGDVWLPGDGWLHGSVLPGEAPERALLRRAALATPGSERGVEIGRAEDGRTVLRGTCIALTAEADFTSREGGEQAMDESDNTLLDIVLDAPVVVRVEVASVTLPAREWAELRSGDVIETGVRLREPVVLRVAGQEVARGELVDVDGELGVRIRELVSPGRAP